MNRRSWLAVAGVLRVAVAGQWLGRTSGSTPQERSRRLPGDELVKRPDVVTNHARSLHAAPEQVFPWLTQVGWHRAGWYTPRWVDVLLFPQNWPSADRLDPELVRNLEPGDVIPDGPVGTAQFVVTHVDAPHLLVLHSTSHVPASWKKRWGAEIDWVWTFVLDQRLDAGTRMQIRTQATTRPWWLKVAYVTVLVPADHVMATGMLRGIDQRSSRSRP
ncbi:MAG: hypothetical protein ACJ74E_01130 [Actinomycetes bacterium]